MTEAWPHACTLGELQRWLQAHSPLPALEQRLLLMHALGLNRIELMTRDQQALDATQLAQLQTLFARRSGGEPIAYILGQREFYSLPLAVSPAVLIPRPETELLVELAASRAPQGGSAADLGTGSGAIVLALAHLRPDLQLLALDASQDALAQAADNAARLHAVGLIARQPQFLHSNWLQALPPAQRFDLIASNPPYIAAGDPHLQQGDLRFEPASALSDGADGLQDLRQIIQHSPAHLQPAGGLLLQHGYYQARAVRALLQRHGFIDVQSWCDLAQIERVSGGRLPT